VIKYSKFIVLKPKKRFIEGSLKNLTKIIILLLLLNNLNAYELTKEEKKYINNKKVILVSNETSYEPYDYNIDGKAMGYSIELLELLLKDTGLKIEYITKPWNELLEDLDNRKLDLVHTIYKTPDREKIYDYSLGYSKVIHSYIIRKNLKDIDDISELEGKKVGISKGWAEEEYFNQFPKIKKVYFKTLKEKLDALSIGEIDAIANDENVASYYIKKYGYTNLKISNPIKKVKCKMVWEYK
jgi:ABC-type amino acid transport substrate-binding protein